MKRVWSGTVEEEKQTRRVLSIRLARVLVLATSLLVSFTVHLLLLHGSSQQNNFNTSGSASAQSDEKDSHQKILLYITTHMSTLHFWYFKACWLQALSHSSLLRNSDVDVMVHMTVPGGSERAALTLVNGTFHGQNLTVQLKDHVVSGKNERVRNRNVNKQNGAMAALSDAAKNHWFEGYDWII